MVLFSALIFAAAVPAQIGLGITASGRLQPVAADACNPQATHQFQCGDLLFVSSTLDLQAWVNHYVTLSGTPQLVLGCSQLSIDVDTIVDASSRLTTLSFNNYRVGSTMALTAQAPLGSVIVHLFTVESALLPLGPIGTLFLNPLTTQQWTWDLGIGLPLPHFLSIPNDPTLVGLTPNFQALVIDPTNLAGIALSNDACFVIRS
jgi:hypothetical protein